MIEKWSIDELQDIWQLATKLHDGQKYGGQGKEEQVPYINHIGSVTFEILKAVEVGGFAKPNLAIKCAVLHDTLEDTALTEKEIEVRFGREVTEGVLALTKKEKSGEVEDKMLDSLNRIKQQPKEVWAVKMADRICNLYAPPFYWTKEKKISYRDEAQVIYDQLKDGNDYLAERLKDKIERYLLFINEQ